MKFIVDNLKKYWIIIGIIILGFILGLYQLDGLPADVWDDAAAHLVLAEQVRQGTFFTDYRYGGDGPIYTYLVVLVSSFFGLSFFTLKLTSVLLYILFIFVMYLLAEAIFKKKDIAYIASFITAVSFWSIMFARQPHARILVPLFIALTLLLALKKKTFLSGLFLGLGMYTQASFWAMPIVFLKRYKILLIGLILVLPLALSFATGSVKFFSNSSYFGEKLAVTERLSLAETLPIIIHNANANLLSFGIKGDAGFRLNVSKSPHLDIISAVFFLGGFLLLFYKMIKEKDGKLFQYIIFPFFVIQIPSILDIHNPFAQPNIGRMIGVIPFVYLSIAYGLSIILQFVIGKVSKNHTVRKYCYLICLFLVLLAIAFINSHKYFITFPKTLPNGNTPFWRTIAKTIDKYPPQTAFFLVESGWRTSYNQERKISIVLSLDKPHSFQTILPETLCRTIQTAHNPVIITDPTDKLTEATIKTCGKPVHDYVLQEKNYDVARFIEIK